MHVSSLLIMFFRIHAECASKYIMFFSEFLKFSLKNWPAGWRWTAWENRRMFNSISYVPEKYYTEEILYQSMLPFMYF